MWILLFFVSPFFTKATGHPYYISNENSSSSAAATLCMLATPPITFTAVGQEVDLPNRTVKPIIESTWVGYVMTYTTFVYKGCADRGFLTNITSSVAHTRADPGHCYSFCKTMFIGTRRMSNTHEPTCYCLQKLPVILLFPHCSVTCTEPKDTLCGSVGYVSVYEKVQEPDTRSSPSGDDKRCLAFQHASTATNMIWSDCSMSYRLFCQNGDTTGQSASWKDSMQTCIDRSVLPADPRALPRVNGNPNALWIGAVRSWSIFNYTESNANNESLLQGYIDTNSTLHFSGQSNSLQLRSLCMGSISTSSSSSTGDIEMTTQLLNATSMATSPVTGESTRHSLSPIGDESSPHSTTSSSGNTTRPARGGSQATKSDDSNGGITVVYVAVPLVAIAIAVAFGIVIWRRRRKLPVKHSPPSEHSRIPSHNGTSPVKGTTISQTDSTTKQADIALRHDYFILEPVNEYAAIKDTNLDQDGDEDYDTTEGATRCNNPDNDTGNIYNRLDDVSEDTYNHTNTLNSRDDETYNHTGNCANETTYNTAQSRSKTGTGPVNSDGRPVSDVDDTYNHIDGAGSKLDHKHDTDVTYNTPECDMRDAKQVANAYSFANPPVKKPVVSPAKGNMKYDYAFAEPGVTGGSKKPIRFTLDQQSTAGNYAFATEPSASADYQLTKPPGH